MLENRVSPQRVITCASLAPQCCLRGHASLLRDCSASRTLGSPLNSTCSSLSNKPNSRSIQSNCSDRLSHWFRLMLTSWNSSQVSYQSNQIITWSRDIDSWILHEIRLNFYLGFTFCFFTHLQSNTDGHDYKFLLLYFFTINTTYISYINVPLAIFILYIVKKKLNFEDFLSFSINWKQNSMYKSAHNLPDLSEHYVLVHTELFWTSSSQRLAQASESDVPVARHNKGKLCKNCKFLGILEGIFLTIKLNNKNLKELL